MAGGLTPRLSATGALIGALALAGAVRAQALSDPTRPPAGASPGSARTVAASSALVLQSVLIRPAARAAIISGEYVALGQKMGALRLVKVAETEVVLQDGAERRTLKLFPGVNKSPVRSETRSDR